jgi:tetratricopeptide (TPR) repeat protein
MKKIVVLACVVCSFFLAAAFRLITRKSADLKQVIAWKRQSSLNCRVPPPGFAEAVDIPPMTGWGHHKWKITTLSDSTQFYFDQGINMYYAFHTLEARASFAKALRFDTTCAMAYYGKALALGPTINFGNGYRAEMAAFETIQAGEKYLSGCSALEKGLIHAMSKRYSADTTADLKILQVNYTSAMRSLAEAYPHHADVVVLYADALMLEHPWDLYDAALQPRPWTPEIRNILGKALAIDSLHPGGLHFMIHTVEGSLHPEDGVKSAELLADLMPDVAHVVHMPSHIYIRSGNYRKGIDVNDRAVTGYNKYVQLYQPVTEGAGLYLLHAVHMKIACAMMAGNFKDAITSSDTIRTLITAADLKAPGGFGNFVQYVYQFRLFTLIRFGKWEEILKAPAADSSTAYVYVLDHFARGMAFSGLGQLTEASRELELLEKGLQSAALKASYDPFSNAYDAGLVAKGILAGVLAEKKKDYKSAREAFLGAVAAEDALIYDEPRDWAIPARQYLGDLLLRMGMFGEAVKVFQRDLEINPMNGWSLTGLRQAYEALGDKDAMRRINGQLVKAWQIRDEEVGRAVF